MKQIIDGKEYDTDKARLVASNRFWDGSNWDRNGRNTYLYKTKRGNFFAVYTTCWEDERDTLTPITHAMALQLYGTLPEREMTYAEAFGEEPEEA
jgi:hypothetical protein